MKLNYKDYPDAHNYGLPETPTVAQTKLSDLVNSNHPYFWFLKNFATGNNPFFNFFFGSTPLDSLQDFQAGRSLRLAHSEIAPTLELFYGTQGGQVEQKLNEDAICIYPIGSNRLLVAVYDGASSQRPITGLEPFGISGAFYVSHLAALGFPTTAEYAKLEELKELTAKEVMITLNDWLRKELGKVEGVDYNDTLSIPGMAATIALIDYNNQSVSIAHVADTIAIATYDQGYNVLTDNRNEHYDQKTLNLVRKIAAEKEISIKEAAKDPRVKQQLAISFRQKINTPDGCGILNGMPELVSNSLIHTANIRITPELRKIYLTSDGLYIPWTGLLNAEPDTSIRQVLGVIDRGVINSPFISATEALTWDDLFQKIQRLKLQDDKAFISVSFPHNGVTKKNDESVMNQALIPNRDY